MVYLPKQRHHNRPQNLEQEIAKQQPKSERRAAHHQILNKK